MALSPISSKTPQKRDGDYPSFFSVASVLKSLKEYISSPFRTTSEKLIRRTESEKEMLVTKHSRLDHPSETILAKTLNSPFFQERDPRALNTLLGQVQGSRVLKGSSLEQKIPPHVGTQLLKHYFQKCSSCLKLTEEKHRTFQNKLDQLEEAGLQNTLLKSKMEQATKETKEEERKLCERERSIASGIRDAEGEIAKVRESARWETDAWKERTKNERESKINKAHETIARLNEEQVKITQAIRALDRDPAQTVIHNQAHQEMMGVYQLKVGDSFFVCGEGSEHNKKYSVIYEFKKTDGDTFELFVYVMGSESGEYGTVLYKDRRSWLRPFMHYQNIPASKLFFTGSQQKKPQSDLFQAILETKNLNSSFSFSPTPQFSSTNLLGFLHSYRVAPDQEMTGFISAPRAHTDGWFAAKTLAFRYLGKRDYKKFALEMKCQSLIEGFCLGREMLGKDTLEGGELRTLLKNGAEGILRQLIIYKRNQWISQEERYAYEATALDLLKRIGEIENQIKTARLGESTTLLFIPYHPETKRIESLTKAKAEILHPKKQETTTQTVPARLPQLWGAQEFTSQLDQFLKSFPEDATTQITEIETLVAQLSIPKSPEKKSSYWSAIPPKDLEKTIGLLTQLLQNYDKAARSGRIHITPREANTVFTLQVVIHFLALRVDNQKHAALSQDNPIRLSAHPLYFPGTLYDNDPFLIYPSPEEFKTRNEIRAYCNKTFYFEESSKSSKKTYYPLFDFLNIPFVQESAVQGKTPHSLSYCTALIRSNPKLKIGPRSTKSDIEYLADLLPHLSPQKAENQFVSAGLGYLPALAYATFVALQYSGYTHLRNDAEGTFSVMVEPTYNRSGRMSYFTPSFQAGGQKLNGFEGSYSGRKLYPNSHAIHPTLSDSYRQFPTVIYAERKRGTSGPHDEGDMLAQRSLSHNPQLLRTCSEANLQPHQLLYYYRNRLDLFTSPEEQTFFELEFFRSVLIEDQERFPLLEELLEGGLTPDCVALINEGVERYFYLQVGNRPNIFATLFFLRLSCRLSRFTKEPMPETLSYLQEMLQLSDLTEEERSALSLHLVLAYSTRNKKMTPQEKAEALKAWVFYKNTPLSPERNNRLLEKEVTSFLHTLQPNAESKENEGESRKLLTSTLNLFGQALPRSYLLQKAPFPLIRATKDNGEFWEINLLTGKVCNEQGDLIRGVAPEWIPKENLSRPSEATKRFRYLFNSRLHTYFKTGTTIYFNDSVWGEMRVINGDMLKGLQRCIDGVWHQYISPEMLNNKDIPSSLLADHTHWVPIEGDESLLFCEFTTGRQLALLTSQGEIHPISPETGIIDKQRLLQTTEEQTVLTKMEKSSYILFTKSKESPETVEQITFSRFQSRSHEPLEFVIEGEKIIYGLNRKYHLSSRQQGGLLGGISQYLLLTHEKGDRQKVLVPVRPLAGYTPLTTLHSIDTKDTTQSWQKEFGIPQKGSYLFVEFDIKKGELVPLSTEATLYLAYLRLAQREYFKAQELLAQISPKQPLSDPDIEILKYMIALCEEKKDASPESAAIAIQAYKLSEKVHHRFKQKNPCPDPTLARSIYQRHQESIPESLQQSIKTEKSRDEQKSSMHRCGLDERVEPIKINTLSHLDYGIDANGSYQERNNYYTAREATSFMLEPTPATFNEPKVHLTVPFGKGYTKGCFRQAYEIARTGRPEERELLRFRLQLIEERRLIEERSNTLSRRSNEWSIIHYALLYPHLAPELPPPNDVKKSWEFLTQVAKLIVKAPPLPSTEKKSYKPVEEELPAPPLLESILPPRDKSKEQPSPLPSGYTAKHEIDGGFTSDLFHTFLKGKKKPASGLEEITFQYDDKGARSEEEKAAKKPIETEFADFFKDFLEGVKENEKRKEYCLKKKAPPLATLQSDLETKSKTLENDLDELETSILELANRLDPAIKEESLLLRESGLKRELNMKNLVHLFLKGNRAAYEKANPYLTHPDFIKEIAKITTLQEHQELGVDYLHNLIGHYLTTAVYKQRLERAIDGCKKAGETSKLSQPEKEYFLQKVAEELNPENLSPYNSRNHPTFLVFEYLSQLAIRPDQVKHLERMLEIDPKTDQYADCVTQMIMGGGKTTVFAVILLQLAAKKGRLSLFVTPNSQYGAVSNNLRTALKDYFDQEMEEIDIPADDIYAMSSEIEKRLQRTMQKEDFLIAKSETLQCLQLKFVTPIFEALNDSNYTPPLTEINNLRRIMILLRTSGDALIDEVDLVLHILQEMNFPLGEKQYVHPGRIELMRKLFHLFVSEEAFINENETINLREKMGLELNKQTLISETDLKGDITRAVAWKFGQSPTLRLNHSKDLQDSFHRYISGEMNPYCQKILDLPKSKLTQEQQAVKLKKWRTDFTEQDEKDLQFLTYVREMRFSENPEKEEAAHQIALIKHMMLNVLPLAFQKIGRRHYGRGEKPGEVRPYQAVDTVSKNHFGYIYEWLTYHFLTALQCGIKEEQFKELASHYRKAAEESLKAKRLVEDPLTKQKIAPEAKEFKELTGIDLDKSDRPEEITKGVASLEKNVPALLKLEAQTASSDVSYHPRRTTANGFSVVNLFNTRRVMSATPYNAHCYEDGLAESFKPEWGTEGKIAAEALQRLQTATTKQVHVTHSRKLEDILKIVANHPQKEKLQMLMDSGALLHDYTTEEVATALRDLLHKPVLFFKRVSQPGQNTKNVLALMPLNPAHPIRIIGGTTPEDIEKSGLDLKDYFVYLDDQNNTGTNLKVGFEAIGIMTVDELMMRRTFFQTILRLREFFFQQRVEYIIPSDVLPLFPQATAKNEQLRMVLTALMGTIRNQAIRKGKDYFKSRKQKIDSLFEQRLLNHHLLIDRDLTKKDFVDLAPYRKVLELSQTDSPYDQVGAIEYSVKSIKDLRRYGAQKIETFLAGGGDLKEAQELEKLIAEVVAKAEKSPWIVETVLSSNIQDLGMEADILSEINKEKIDDVDKELQNELLAELETYEKAPAYSLRPEDIWDDKTIESFLKAKTTATPFVPDASQKNKGDFTTHSLPSLFESEIYKRPYKHFFDEAISATHSWANVTRRELSCFHRMHRPAEQILVIQTAHGYQAILLSLKEAAQFQKFLRKNYSNNQWKNAWLILPDGSLFQDNPLQPLPLKEIEPLLIEINALNGNLTYLELHPEATKTWLEKGGLSEEKIHFLKLRIVRDLLKFKQIQTTPLFGGTTQKQNKNYAQYLRERAASLKPEEIRSLGPNDKHLLRALEDYQLVYLQPHQIALLKPHQRNKLSNHKEEEERDPIVLSNATKEPEKSSLSSEILNSDAPATTHPLSPLKTPPFSNTPEAAPSLIPDLKSTKVATPSVTQNPPPLEKLTLDLEETEPVDTKPLHLPLKALDDPDLRRLPQPRVEESNPLQPLLQQPPLQSKKTQVSSHEDIVLSNATKEPEKSSLSSEILNSNAPATTPPLSPLKTPLFSNTPEAAPSLIPDLKSTEVATPSVTQNPPPLEKPTLHLEETEPVDTKPLHLPLKALDDPDPRRLPQPRVEESNPLQPLLQQPPLQSEKTQISSHEDVEQKTHLIEPAAAPQPAPHLSPLSPHPITHTPTSTRPPVLDTVAAPLVAPHPKVKMPLEQSKEEEIDAPVLTEVPLTKGSKDKTKRTTSKTKRSQTPHKSPVPKVRSNEKIIEHSKLPLMHEMDPSDPSWSRCIKVTVVVLAVLGGLIFVTLTILGVLAIIGTQAPSAPHFMVSLAQHLGPSFVPYLLSAGGPAYVILVALGLLIRRKCCMAPQNTPLLRV